MELRIVKMDKTEVKTLIHRKNDRVSFVSSTGKSNVWKDFILVIVDDPFVDVKCVRCNTALKWKSRDSTSGLHAHVIIKSVIKAKP